MSRLAGEEVPGTYLVRAWKKPLAQVREDLTPHGLIFIRKFLAGLERSDYLVLFSVLAGEKMSLPLANLQVGEFTYHLRPFRVMTECSVGFDKNNLTVSIPQISSPDVDPFVHVEKCHEWVRHLMSCIVRCGVLPNHQSFTVDVLNPEKSRSTYSNMNLMQLQFSPEVPGVARVAVHAILRGSEWGSLSSSMLRCWWRDQTLPQSNVGSAVTN